MVKWEEMSTTWKMMPEELKNEITRSGVRVPIAETQNPPSITLTSPTHYSISEQEQKRRQWIP
jgi:hypothetical protein